MLRGCACLKTHYLVIHSNDDNDNDTQQHTAKWRKSRPKTPQADAATSSEHTASQQVAPHSPSVSTLQFQLMKENPLQKKGTVGQVTVARNKLESAGRFLNSLACSSSVALTLLFTCSCVTHAIARTTMPGEWSTSRETEPAFHCVDAQSQAFC